MTVKSDADSKGQDGPKQCAREAVRSRTMRLKETSIRLVWASRLRRVIAAIFGLVAPAAIASIEMFSGDGYFIRPPLGFAPVELDFYRGSRLGIISADSSAGGFLAAAFANDEIAGTATMLISVAEGSFSATPAARDEFAVAAVKHFEELRMKFAIQSVDLISSGARRVELTGTLIDERKQRHLLIAAMPGRKRHQVILFSLPIGEFPRWAPIIRTSLESFGNIQGTTFWTGDRIAASAALLGAGVLTWMFLSQNRRGERVPKTARK